MLDSIRKHLPKSSVDILIFTMYSTGLSRPQLPKSRSQQIIETRGSALSHSTRHARFYQETSSKVFRRHSHFHHVFCTRLSRPQLPKSRSQQIIETRGSALSHSTRHARFYQETSSKVFRRHSHFHHVFCTRLSRPQLPKSRSQQIIETRGSALSHSTRHARFYQETSSKVFRRHSHFHHVFCTRLSRPQLPKSRSQQIIETRGSALSHSTRHARFYQETSSKVFRRHSHFHHVFHQVETSTSKVSFSTNNRN